MAMVIVSEADVFLTYWVLIKLVPIKAVKVDIFYFTYEMIVKH